jgi:hypothetical protein
MQIFFDRVIHACPENPRGSVITHNLPLDLHSPSTRYTFYKEQNLVVTRDQPAYVAQVLIDGSLVTRTSTEDWHNGQFTFTTKDPLVSDVVTIFRDRQLP